MFTNDPYNFFRRRLNQKEIASLQERERYNVTDEIDFLFTTEELKKQFKQLDIIVHDSWSKTGCIREREEK